MKVSIFVPGHSVVKMPDGSFRPSSLYQEITYPDQTKSFPFQRTGIWNPDLDPNSKSSYLGGGEIVVKASVILYNRLR